MDPRLYILAGAFLFLVVALLYLSAALTRARRAAMIPPPQPTTEWPMLKPAPPEVEAAARADKTFAAPTTGISAVLSVPLRTGEWRPDSTGSQLPRTSTADDYWDTLIEEESLLVRPSPARGSVAEVWPGPPAVDVAKPVVPAVVPAAEQSPQPQVPPAVPDVEVDQASAEWIDEIVAQLEGQAAEEAASVPPPVVAPAPVPAVEPEPPSASEAAPMSVPASASVSVDTVVPAPEPGPVPSAAPVAAAIPAPTPVVEPAAAPVPAPAPQPTPISVPAPAPAAAAPAPVPVPQPEPVPVPLPVPVPAPVPVAEPVAPRPAAVVPSAPVPPAAAPPRPSASEQVSIRVQASHPATITTGAEVAAPVETDQSALPNPADTSATSTVAVSPISGEPVAAAVASANPERDEAIHELVAPVEMWFGDVRIGVKAGSRTYDRFQKIAHVLFEDLKRSSSAV